MYVIFRYCLFFVSLFVFISVQAQTAVQQSKSIKQDPKFTLTAIHFNQVELVDSFEFFPFYEAYLGAQISISKLREICGDITRLYRERGFQAANCNLPPQRIVSGVVKMQIVEGVIGRVRVTGDVEENNSLLGSYVSHIALNKPLDMKQLAYVERLIGSLPGTDVRVYVEPIEGSNKLELVFDIQRTRFSGEVYVNNRGSEIIGPVQGGLSLASYSLLGLNEYLRLNLLASDDPEELTFAEVNTSWPVTDEGSLLLFDTSYADSKPGEFLNPSRVDVQVSSSRLGWSSPLSLTATETLLVTGWLDYFRSDTNIATDRIALDEIYKVKLSLDYITNYSRHYTKTNIALSHGLPGLNTTVSNADGLVSTGKEDFDALRFDVFYRTVLLRNLLLSFQTQGQYAFVDLPVSEYIVFGGEVMGSAYDPVEFFGDHGLGGKSRLTYQFEDAWLYSGYTQWYMQYDVVKIWNKGLDIINSGASLATGVTIGSGSFYLDLQAAKPLTKPVLLEGNNSVRYFGNLRVFF